MKQKSIQDDKMKIQSIEPYSENITFTGSKPRILSLINLLAYIVASILCLLFGMMLIWQRGFYLDDYSNLLMLTNPVNNEIHSINISEMPFFPIRVLTWVTAAVLTSQLPNNEFLVRLLVTIGVGINALLIGVLVNKLLHSRIATAIAVWILLCPAFSAESVLWVGASAYVFATTWFLVYIILAFEQIQSPSLRILYILGAYIAFGISFLYVELSANAIGIVLLLGIWYAFQHRAHVRRITFHSLLMVLGPILMLLGMYWGAYKTSNLVAARGGMISDTNQLINRIQILLQQLDFMLISPTWGRAIYKQAFLNGLQSINDTLLGLAAFAAIVIFLWITIMTWNSEDSVSKSGRWQAASLVIIGIIWVIATLFLPTIALLGQSLEYRLLYVPLTGVALTMAAFASWILGKSPPLLLVRAILSLCALFLLVNTITLLGFTYTYAARYALDKQQVLAFTTHIPGDALPEDVIIVPYQPDERLFGQPVETQIMRQMVGVFEARWTATSVFRVAYQRPQVQVITANRWVPLAFSHQPGSSMITIQDQEVAIDRLLLFTYQDQQLFLIPKLTLTQDNSQIEVIEFPIVQKLQAQGIQIVQPVMVRNLFK